MAIGAIDAQFARPTAARAITTLVTGGVSEGVYRSANLSHTVGDDPEHVAENRRLLSAHYGWRSEPVWLTQVHGTAVWCAPESINTTADASVTTDPHAVLAVLTADCLPVVLVSPCGQRRGIAHAGWRGLAAGVIENTVVQLRARGATELLAWLGPCIGPQSFEVGAEVLDAFARRNPDFAVAFRPGVDGRYWADLQQLARMVLSPMGIAVTGCSADTLTDPRLYSFRRQNPTGRMATVVWLP